MQMRIAWYLHSAGLSVLFATPNLAGYQCLNRTARCPIREVLLHLLTKSWSGSELGWS
ncbi:hypothetical protein FB570_11114 [Streptomyces sp. T12]|nr:hypothetical protein FB570_11114 [Streptomyces sp. T12]